MGELHASATVRWSGWTGTVTGESGRLAAPTATQLELGGPGGGTNPEELLAAAHANCFTSTLTALARARKLALDEVSTSVTTRLAWDDGGHDHTLASSTLSLRILSAEPEAALRDLVRETEERCPVCRALSGNVPLTVAFEVERPA